MYGKRWLSVMSDFKFKSNWQFIKSQRPQWRELHTRELIDRGIAKTPKLAENLEGNVLALKAEALPIYDAMANAMQKSYDDIHRNNYKAKNWLEEKKRGFIGNDAIQSLLNQLDYGYKVDQIMAFYDEDRIWHDFILYPSKIRVEVKTSGDFATEKWHMLINKEHWQDVIKAGVPDVVLALKKYETVPQNILTVEFMGWVYGKDVETFDVHEGFMCPNGPCYRRKAEDLNKAPNLVEFLAGMAERGTEYLARLVGE